MAFRPITACLGFAVASSGALLAGCALGSAAPETIATTESAERVASTRHALAGQFTALDSAEAKAKLHSAVVSARDALTEAESLCADSSHKATALVVRLEIMRDEIRASLANANFFTRHRILSDARRDWDRLRWSLDPSFELFGCTVSIAVTANELGAASESSRGVYGAPASETAHDDMRPLKTLIDLKARFSELEDEAVDHARLIGRWESAQSDLDAILR